MKNDWLTYEQALKVLGDKEYMPPGLLVQNVVQARAIAAAKRALKCRIARPALYDKEYEVYACPSCKEALEREDYEFDTGYCKVCGQKIEFKKR